MGLCWGSSERQKLTHLEGRKGRTGWRGNPHPAASGSALPRWGRFFVGAVGWGLEVGFYDEWEVADWEELD
jgi:hypothetical protein